MITREVTKVLAFYAASSGSFQRGTRNWSTTTNRFSMLTSPPSSKVPLAKAIHMEKKSPTMHATMPCGFPHLTVPQNAMPSAVSRSRSSSLLSLYQSADSITPMERGSKNQSTTVYALILASIILFISDNILHVRACRALYFYHKNWRWWQPLTSTFCHGSRSHLSGNLFLLLLFGRSVEDELGSFGLLFSYIFCGVVANLISLVWLPQNTVSIGASGAVYGLFAVSICSRLSWKDILSWRKMIEVGVLGQFVVSRVLEEAKTAATGGVKGVNHVAHLAGTGAGVAMVLLLRGLVKNLEGKDNRK